MSASGITETVPRTLGPALGGTGADPSPGDERSFSTHPRRRVALPPDRLARLRAVEDELTAKLSGVLDAQVDSVAVVARAGSDLSGLRFVGEPPRHTHCAFALREAGRWRLLHLINTHGGARGDLYSQPLHAFFRDDPWEYHCEVLVPTRALQARLRRGLVGDLPEILHRERYSAIAHPRSQRYQQSNQWLLEVIGAVTGGARTRERIQAHLFAHGLRPSAIRKRLLAGYVGQWAYGAFSSNTRFDDHPPAERWSGVFAFASPVTVRDYLTDNGLLDRRVEICAGLPAGSPCPAGKVLGSGDL